MPQHLERRAWASGCCWGASGARSRGHRRKKVRRNSYSRSTPPPILTADGRENVGSPGIPVVTGQNSLSRRARPLEILGRPLNDVLFSREFRESQNVRDRGCRHRSLDTSHPPSRRHSRVAHCSYTRAAPSRGSPRAGQPGAERSGQRKENFKPCCPISSRRLSATCMIGPLMGKPARAALQYI